MVWRGVGEGIECMGDNPTRDGSATTDADVRGIRKLGSGSFEVRVSIAGEQQYGGAFPTLDEAIAVRDLMRLDRKQPAQPGPKAAKPKRRRVDTYGTGYGLKYSASVYHNGASISAGPHATRKGAVDAQQQLLRKLRDGALAVPAPEADPRLPPGVRRLFNRKRQGHGAALVPRYAVRDTKGAHVGTFDTAAEAIAARNCARSA